MERKIDWNCVFDYDETSPSCLRWKIDRWAGQYHNIPKALQGDAAGGLLLAEPPQHLRFAFD